MQGGKLLEHARPTSLAEHRQPNQVHPLPSLQQDQMAQVELKINNRKKKYINWGEHNAFNMIHAAAAAAL